MIRIVVLIIAVAALAGGFNPVTTGDKAEGVALDSWRDFLYEMPHDLYAQVEEEGENLHFGPGKPGQHRRQRKHIEQLRMLKMLELLDLDQEQEISFLTSYNELRRDIRRVDEARMKLLKELGDKLHDETGADSDIKNTLNQVDANRKEKQKVEAAFLERAATMLSVRQLGKLIMFNEHFERELLDRVRVYREGRKGRERQAGP